MSRVQLHKLAPGTKFWSMKGEPWIRGEASEHEPWIIWATRVDHPGLTISDDATKTRGATHPRRDRWLGSAHVGLEPPT